MRKGHIKVHACFITETIYHTSFLAALCGLFIICLLATMFNRSDNLRQILSLVPGKKSLGTYRFLPIFFCIGGVMEWIMINVRIGKETFCK